MTFYEVIIERHRSASTIVTSNRAIEEWIPPFDDPILAQIALDRLTHNAYQIALEGRAIAADSVPDRPPLHPHPLV